tara:strand:+ start:672 stop:1775 length:1104 start_codon:yes stop_codon:yes gene_type:complete
MEIEINLAKVKRHTMEPEFNELRISNDAKDDPEELKRRIYDEGYLFFKQLLNSDKLLELRRQILTTLQEGGWLMAGTDPMDGIADVDKKCTEGDRKYTEIYHKVQKLEALHRSGHWPETLDMIEKIMGRPAMPFPHQVVRLWFPKYTKYTTPIHQDFVHFQGHFDNLTAWAPIGDCPIELGGLAVIPGSHKVAKVLDHHFALGAGGLNIDVDKETMKHPEITGSWYTTNYEVGDCLIFPALTIHKALPNVTEDQMRASLDNRYNPVGEPIAEHMLEPHLNNNGELTWEQIYEDWQSDDLKYFWRNYNNPLVPHNTDFYEKGFADAIDRAREGEAHAILRLKTIVENDPDTPNGVVAKGVLKELGGVG